jgi:hypothetical protein
MSHPSHILEEFQPEKLLSSSHRATVFRATDPSSDCRVAVKLIHPAGPVVEEVNRSAFLYSMEVARSGVMPALPRTLDFGLTDERNAFLVTEWMELSTPLAGLGGEHPSRLVPILNQLVNAIDGLALAGVAHLNLNPDNVLVSVDDSVRLVGYGTAAYLVGSESGSWPGAENRFAAPEAFRGDVLRRENMYLADLYSLAMMACELLGAELSGSGDIDGAVRLPSGVLADTEAAEAILAAALRRRPETREISLSDLRRVLVCEGQDQGLNEGDAPGLAPPGFETRRIVVPQEPIGVPSGGIEIELPEDCDEPLDGEEASTELEADSAAIELIPEDEDLVELPRSGIPWRSVATVAAAMILLVVVVRMVMSRPAMPERPQVLAATPAPTESLIAAGESAAEAVQDSHPELEAAEQLMLAGDAEAARAALESMSDDEVEGLSEAERVLFDTLADSMASADRGQALRALAGGLEHGSIRMLRRAVAGFGGASDAELEDNQELRQRLDLARRALKTHKQLWDARRAGDHLVVLGKSGEMIDLLPGYSGSEELRVESAVALESAAETMISDGDFEAAVLQLDAIKGHWPDRVGLDERIAWCTNRIETDRRMLAVLEAAREAATRGDPEDGLRMLAATAPSVEFSDQFDAMRTRLEDQLAALDSESPQIVMPEGFQKRYRKNTTIVVPISVTDDYRVERVVVGLKANGDDRFSESELNPDDSGAYTIEIAPDRHRNDKVSFYVSAEDRSGHLSKLGGPSDPVLLERKKWFKK